MNLQCCIVAAKAGDIAELARCYEQCWLSYNEKRLLSTAARLSGQLESVQWLSKVAHVSYCGPSDHNIMAYAAEYGQLDVLRFLGASGMTTQYWDVRLCEHATRHPECLKWLRQQGVACPWDSSCLDAVVRRGDLELLKWMREQQPPCPFSLQYAIISGNLAMVQWLRQQAVLWDPHCLWQAFWGGSKNLEMVQWMLSQHPACPYNVEHTRICALRGDMVTLQWCIQQDVPWISRLQRLLLLQVIQASWLGCSTLACCQPSLPQLGVWEITSHGRPLPCCCGATAICH